MVGRLAQDPQQFVTRNGITQSRISIASSDAWNKNETYFFPCIAWQTTANFINSYLHKGDLVAIDGKLIRRSYISKEGKTVYVIEIVIETIKALSSKTNPEFSSIDKNYQPHKNSFIKNNEFQQNTSYDQTNENNVNQTIQNEIDLEITDELNKELENKTDSEFNEDPFADEDDVVNLDWLDEFKD